MSGVRLAAYGLATVDTAAIAAAVAGALSIPTAVEIAAEVDAQGSAAAAITAATLATAGAVSTLQTAVNLLPVDGDVTTLVGAAVDAKLAAIASAVAAAVPDATDVQAAAAAGYGDAWGTVLQVKAQYFGATALDQTGTFIAAPGAGLRIEILSWGVTSFATAGGFTWSSGATLNIDTGPDVQPRNLAKGSQISAAAVSPEHPLYTLAENANFGITIDVDSEVVVDIAYRIVSTT